jgi:hypothetical protein
MAYCWAPSFLPRDSSHSRVRTYRGGGFMISRNSSIRLLISCGMATLIRIEARLPSSVLKKSMSFRSGG